jgi:hypothetical protein
MHHRTCSRSVKDICRIRDIVPVDVDEVDLTSCTCINEGPEVLQAVGSVGDSRRSEIHLVLEELLRLDVLLPCCNGSTEVHAGAAHARANHISNVQVLCRWYLLAVVRLVETKQMGG